MKNRKVKIILGTFLLMFCSVSSYAQFPPTFPGGDNVNDQAPISSLIALGLIAGAVYGIRKSRK
mgnify:FL=1